MKVSTYDECVSLKIILQNFLNHVETLEVKRNEGDDQYEREFQELKLLSESLKGLSDYSCKEGEKEVNRRKNRYKDILPFDSTRVTISEFPGVPGSNYINANYIRGASGSPAYIASQGPLANTLTDFWRMVVECEVQIIIMACNEEESGKHKCENYWLDVEDEVKISGPYTVRLLKARTVCPDFRLRTLELTYPNNEGELVTRTVIQFHYCAWPDHGVPTLVRPLLDMVRLIRDCQVSETLPLLVHCSAGCGRTGTICAIDYVWGLLRAGKLTADFSLFNLISDMRKQRIAMVQTKEQYILVHRAVRELFLDQLKMIDAHPYENLDLHGRPLITPVHKIDPNYETIFIQNHDTGLESMVSEVSEQDDVCEDTDSENLPWPVVQLQATLANKTDLPKPKPQLATLPPLPLSSSPLDCSIDSFTDVNRNHTGKDEFSKDTSPLSQTRSSLIRRPSILKLKALFEKSPEPRNSTSPEKKSQPHKKNSVKKASSFRLREEHFKSSKDGFKIMEFKEFCHPPKLSLASEFHADAETEPILPASTTSTDEKPVLPIKRSKSMKVYRDFDLEQRKKMIVEPIQVEVITPPSFEYVRDPVPASVECVAKNLLVSSLDRGSRDSKCIKQEPLKASDVTDYKEAMWSGTCGSLDRVLKSEEAGKATSVSESAELPRTESQTVPIFKAESGPVKDLRPAPQYVSPVHGKTSTGSNTTPYANVALLKRSGTTPLDDDARQVLKSCQAYLADDVPLPLAVKPSMERKQSPLTSPAKVKAAVSTEIPADLAQIARNARDRLAKLVAPIEGRQRQRRDSFKQAVWVGGAEKVLESQVSSAKTKNVNDYEAIWLSGKSPEGTEGSQDEGGGDEDEVDSNAPAPIAMEPVYVNLPSVKRGIQVHNAPPVSQAQLTEARNLDFQAKLVNKEAIFVQKSGEISHLLSELRVTAEPGATASSPASQRSRDDYAKISKKHSVPLGVVSPSATRKAPPYVNYPQPLARSGAVAPVKSPTSGKKTIASYFYPAPLDSLSNELDAKHKALTPSTSLYVTLPPDGGSIGSATAAKDNASRQRRREPPKYQAPPDPPCKRLPGEISRPPIAPPRGVKRISSLGNLPLDGTKENANVAPLVGSPGSFHSSPVGVDIDAIAASINLNEGTKPAASESWSGSPLANKALSKALGKFHATAQSLKTKFVQLGDALDSGTSSKNATVAPEAENNRSERIRSSSDKSRQPIGFPPDTVTNSRKKQQYL